VIWLVLLGPLFQGTPVDDTARAWREDEAAARALALPALRTEDLARWTEWILPDANELAFEEVPWIASFSEGLRAAERAQKPLLFWAMNGHPLGCT
jgi:hypothetical protein